MDEAELIYRNIIVLNPTCVIAYAQLGYILHSTKKNSQEAEFFLVTALALDPNCLSALYNLANMLSCKGDLCGAEKTFRRVPQIQPDHFEAHYNLANVRTEHYKPYTHTTVQPVSVIYFVSVGNALSAVTLLWQMPS